jgi:hypothetical protein
VTIAVSMPKAAFEPAGDVVFATAFPGTEVAPGRNAFIAGIEAQHDFAQAHQFHKHSRFGVTFSFAMILG